MKRFYLCMVIAISMASPASVFGQNEARELAISNYQRYFSDGQKTKDAKKEKSIKDFRNYYAANAYRGYDLSKIKITVPDILSELNDEGIFNDLIATQQKVMAGTDQQAIGLFLTEAFNRIWKVAEEFRGGRMSVSQNEGVFRNCQKAILYYGDLETSRSNKVHRFHASCFAIPTAAVNTYFCFLKQMDAAETGKSKDEQMVAVCDMLKAVALQAWTQPLRHDDTDQNVVSLDRFRNHVWWVGGNALAYRSLLPVAFMYRSAPMVDLLVEVCQKGIGSTSQHTYETAFWTEGCTADGAGWGHGMQCLVWGYPIDGNIHALSILSILKETPWDMKLTADNVETLFNFIQGSNWYYYKGYVVPFVDRFTTRYESAPAAIRTLTIVDRLLKEWSDSFTAEQKEELKRFQRDARGRLMSMKEAGEGIYNGTRWFFNNDDLIKKNDRYHLMVNMASVRCDGLESAVKAADEYNFYPADGMTLFQRTGNEYREVVGAWDMSATPGVTAREAMDRLTPVTNWRGYCSKHHFAGASTFGGENAVAGYLFEKMDASSKDNDKENKKSSTKNEVLYGVKAYKSYFIIGDYLVALGAGITNLHPQMPGTIRTTIDQPKREGEVYAWCDGKQLPIESGIQSFPTKGKPFWVVQKGKFAYSILPQYTARASFACETLKSDWLKMNTANKGKANLPAQVDVLRLWVDHTQTPVNDTYGYVVYTGSGNPAAELPCEVLRNDTLVQAVRSKDSKVIEAVFYQPNVLLNHAGVKLQVSSPCTLLIEEKEGKYDISVTDATMNKDLKEIVIHWNGKRIPVRMPQGALCGKPAIVRNV